MPRRIDTQAVINAVRLDEQAGDPAQPAAGYRLIYAKNDGIYEEDDAGVVTGPLGAGGGGGAPDDATYWVEDADGDLSNEVVVGTTGITTTTYAGRQAAAKSGRLFFPSNGHYIERDTGAAWSPWGPIFPFTTPVLGDFSWVNQDSSTVDQTYGGIYMKIVDANNHGLFKAAPSTPYSVQICCMGIGNADYNMFLAWRQSSDGKLVAISYRFGPTINVEKWNDPDTFSAGYSTASVNTATVIPAFWLKIVDDGSTRYSYWGIDGQHWTLAHSVGRTDFMTADQVGFGLWCTNASGAQGLFLHWKEGTS